MNDLHKFALTQEILGKSQLAFKDFVPLCGIGIYMFQVRSRYMVRT